MSDHNLSFRKIVAVLFLSIGVAACVSIEARVSDQESFPTQLLVDLDRSPNDEFPLWPNGAPGGSLQTKKLSEHYVERTNKYDLRDRAVLEITTPTLKVFKPESPSGSALLIIPGGGYKHVVVEKEGYEGARFFNQLGITVYVLKYRLPHQGWEAGPDTPLQDAQRAVRLIRSRAELDDINPDKLAVMGFSAGGHVAASLSTRYLANVYDTVDSADALSAKPNLSALIYPVISMDAKITHSGSRKRLLGNQPTQIMIDKYSVDVQPENKSPPTFIMHAADDESVSVKNALRIQQVLFEDGIEVELHVFATGGHGFGLRGLDGKPQRSWPELFYNFAESHGVL